MLFYYFNGRNAARTCRHFGISRQTFYRWKRRFDRHDLTTLEERSHRPRAEANVVGGTGRTGSVPA
jgi:transposase-like protein